jgi:hypothetical protein
LIVILSKAKDPALDPPSTTPPGLENVDGCFAALSLSLTPFETVTAGRAANN